ncbi:ATP-binding protein [Methanosarcinales archaeon]|nr:MAG: ATP-binding protein [Methanosarcinales archaeon]
MEQQKDINKEIEKRLASVKHKLVVLSGKGGVGKSTTTSCIAVTLAKRGYKVGVFDYDFHGPAIPRMLGVSGRPEITEDGIIPPEGIMGIKVFSVGLLLSDEKSPVIWRGPLKYNVLREFLSKLEWGELDFLLFDLPPGTGDEALNIAQTIPGVDGAIVVTIPSEVSRVAVEKSVEFCRKLNIKPLGVIENMSYLVCPNCSHRIEIFGKGGGEKIMEEEGIQLLGKIALEPAISKAMDSGNPLTDSKIVEVFDEIVDKILRGFS